MRANITNVDNRTIFPNTIEVIEKRAPTDDSVRLLNEMHDKAVSNIICKISNDRNNTFKWEAYFMNIASLDLEQAGFLLLKLVVNGKKYEKKIKVRSDFMRRLAYGDKHYFDNDIDSEVRRFLFFQISFMVGEILLKDTDKFNELMDKMVRSGAVNFDYNTLNDIDEYYGEASTNDF
jgi:hypothetical protein